MRFLRMAAAKSPLAPLYERGDVAVQHYERDADILGNASSREAEKFYVGATPRKIATWAIWPATLYSDHLG